MQNHANHFALSNSVRLSIKRGCQLIPLLATIRALTTTAPFKVTHDFPFGSLNDRIL